MSIIVTVDRNSDWQCMGCKRADRKVDIVTISGTTTQATANLHLCGTCVEGLRVSLPRLGFIKGKVGDKRK